jgi:SMI1 / KNR4 family (SUKH-1)
MNTHIKFEYPHPPISKETLEAYEKQLDFTLPEVYRSFLLEYNGGGLLTYGCFDYQLPNGKDSGSAVSHFFGLDVDAYKNLKYSQAIQDKPNYLFLIGHSLSSLLGIGVRGDHFSKVYVWEHTKNNDVILLANSFNEFLDMLYDEE